MARVTTVGGVFLRSPDPEALYAWYERHLEIKRAEGTFLFPASEQRAATVLAVFLQPDTYWPSAQPLMLNLQVDDLDAVLDRLVTAGVEVDPKRKSCSYGRFGWFTDPDGNRAELWEPPAAKG